MDAIVAPKFTTNLVNHLNQAAPKNRDIRKV